MAAFGLCMASTPFRSLGFCGQEDRKIFPREFLGCGKKFSPKIFRLEKCGW
jgi:hypothetical protein